MEAKGVRLFDGLLAATLMGCAVTCVFAEQAPQKIASAFDIETVTIYELLPLQEDDSQGPVRQASAASSVDDPRLLERLRRAEQLASRARTIGDLGDVIEQIGVDPADKSLARVAAWALNRRGELYAEAGNERAAFDDFQRALATDDHCWNALHNRGVTLARYGRGEAALEDFTRALRLNPRFTACYANRAALHLELGHAAAAEADYTRALADLADDAKLYAGRAAARADLGRTSDAVRDLNEALRLAPKSAELHAQRGALFAGAGHYEQAVADFSMSMQLDPRCAAAYQGVAWLLATCEDAKFRDGAKAVEAAERALHFGDSSDPVLLATAAAAHAAAGDRTQAIRYGQQALLVAPAEEKAEHSARLARYRQGLAYRESK